MRSFLKDYSVENIKVKLLLLYILNLTDIIFTLLLLSTGFYVEANILMAKATQNPIIALLLKIIIPALFFITIYIRIKKATNQQLKKSNYIINIATAFYALINLSHLIWFSILPIFLMN